jgi:hypothetical protein
LPSHLTGEIDLADAEDYLAVARAMITEGETAPCFTIDLSGPIGQRW